jgi:hypothetical protein
MANREDERCTIHKMLAIRAAVMATSMEKPSNSEIDGAIPVGAAPATIQAPNRPPRN